MKKMQLILKKRIVGHILIGLVLVFLFAGKAPLSAAVSGDNHNHELHSSEVEHPKKSGSFDCIQACASSYNSQDGQANIEPNNRKDIKHPVADYDDVMDQVVHSDPLPPNSYNTANKRELYKLSQVFLN